MLIIGDPENKHIKVWTDTNNTLIDENTIKQAKLLLEMDFVTGVALMPDAHVGIGSTVGSVIATKNAIIPATLGVDLACGLSCTELLQVPNGYFIEHPEKKQELYDNIRRTVPSGFPCTWNKIPERVQEIWDTNLREGYEEMKKEYPRLVGKNDVNQLGTLGSGNHFIEISEDSEHNYYLVLHSGSRGIGNKIGQYFIRAAKDVCKNNRIVLPHADLAYLTEGTQFYADYIKFVTWAAAYADYNRKIMETLVVEQVSRLVNRWVKGLLPRISCNHNFGRFEVHNDEVLFITRKGAISAANGEKSIIGGSMNTFTYLCEGLGNSDSFKSSSHGAGRSMGRKVAKQSITHEQHKASLDGVVCDNSSATLDESPSAYKDIDLVMDAQKDLTRPYKRLKQIINVKGQE